MLSTNLKFLRTNAKITQTEFGKLFEASRGMIDSYERSKAEPSPAFIKKVSAHFKISLDALVNKDLSKTQGEHEDADALKLKDDLIAALQKQIKSQQETINKLLEKINQ